MTALILASSSPYRRQLLARLDLSFDCISPAIDETARPGEHPRDLVSRLAESKARACADGAAGALVIGSDQVASLGEQILTKPGDFANAREQLRRCSGETVTFYTGLALLNSADNRLQQTVELTRVVFRRLQPAQIDRYLQKEQPFDCAGSFKMEGLGISLFEKIVGDDPNALIGLPLIRLVTLLAREGVEVP